MRFILLLLVLSGSSYVQAQSSLVRGPYLNILTQEGVVVKWRTTVGEKGMIRYGAHPDSLGHMITEGTATTEHEIKISGLQPDTRYYYQIGSGEIFYTPASEDFRFKTAPLPDTRKPIRIWAFGDFGDGSIHQKRVRDAYIRHYEQEDTDLWLWLGDNAYNDGTDEEFQTKVFEVFPEELARMVVWPTPGNHDYKSISWLTHQGPYYDIFTLPKQGEAGGEPSKDESYYSFDYGNIHFISINSEYVPHILNNNTIFTKWLERDLKATRKDWIIAFWHQPPYSKGTHDSDDFFSNMEMVRKFVNPVLERYGCDLVLNGHSHGYERSYMIRGHFGFSNTFKPESMLIDGSNGNPNDGNTYQKYLEGSDVNQGTVYVVAGSGGKKGDGSSLLNHPAMYMSTENYHGSLVIDVDGLTLHARFIDTTGGVIDEFAIQKNRVATPVKGHQFDRLVQLNTYPNPFTESFTIEFILEEPEKVEISIRDLFGRMIQHLPGQIYPAGQHRMVIQTEGDFPAGIYLVELKTADRLSAKRMLHVE